MSLFEVESQDDGTPLAPGHALPPSALAAAWAGAASLSALDTASASTGVLLRLRDGLRKYSPDQPRDERGRFGATGVSSLPVEGRPAVWPDDPGGRGQRPLPESVQPRITEPGDKYIDGYEEMQRQQEVWKDRVAQQIAARLDTPAALAALASSPGLGGPGSLMSSGGVFVAGGDPLDPRSTTAIEGRWPSMTPEERTAAMRDNPSVRYAIAAGFVHSWANTSSDSEPQALAIQMAAAKEFGLPVTVQNRDGEWSPAVASSWSAIGVQDTPQVRAVAYLGQNEAGLRALLRTAYDNTQAQFAAAGISEVTVTRGVTSAPTEVPRTENPILHRPTADFGESQMWSGTVQSNPLSSWTTDRSVARGFGDYHLTTTVPVSRVFSTAATGFGCALESEVVLLGGPTNVVADRKWS